MKQLVIFDLDGTLLDTISDLGSATNHALRAFGYPEHNLASYTKFVGNGITRLIERSLPEDDKTPETVAKVREKFTEYYNEHKTDLTRPYPGIPELLKELGAMGVKMAVASNKYQSAVVSLVRHYFPDVDWKAVEGNKEGVPTKPDPSIVFEILSKCPTRKSKVLYVGDSGVDMETARRACVDSCGVSWGFRSVKELRDHHADNIVDSPDEIITVVKRPGLELDV
ncbi:MAG: HAD family hydrolase [Duncaniella sp.]|uniref:HAD family hydrolase n=1 Tax=Duncaniella sp. TaxID=2518496 RepID=UPI0023CA0777|nr:HAD family hydrolase [Duncaniella sp.]MDE5988015.1 HAD family hydrolase [Duncaniella sp.]